MTIRWNDSVTQGQYDRLRSELCPGSFNTTRPFPHTIEMHETRRLRDKLQRRAWWTCTDCDLLEEKQGAGIARIR